MVEGVGAVQPGIVADRPAWLGCLPQIGRDAPLDQISNFKNLAVHLVPDLDRVAPVNEHRCGVFQDHRRPGGSGKAGRPGQAIVGLG